MILASISFPEKIQNDKKLHNDCLKKLKSNAIKVWKLVRLGNRLDVQTKKFRLKLTENYIKDTLRLNIGLNKLIPFIIRNIKYDNTGKYLIIDSNEKVDNVRVETLLKLIEFGNSELKGSDIIQYCIQNGYNMTLVNMFILKWGSK